MKRIIFNWTVVVIFTVVLYFVSTHPISGPVDVKNIDKLCHFGFYAVYVMFICRASEIKLRAHKFPAYLLAIIIASAYGAFMEYLQSFIPERNTSLADGIANMLGASFGTVLYMFAYRTRMKWRSLHADRV